MFEKIDRVAIAVKDLEKAKDFFSDLLDIDFDIVGQNDALGMRGAYSASGLELIESSRPDSMIAKFIEQRGEGLWALVLKVRDMDEAIKKFKEKGLKIAGDVKAGTMREVAFHPKGSHGVEIVLAEYPEKHPATVAAASTPEE
jgi:methylmalonyl-CoA/ethylmalonyl-CoA epimerase